MFSARNKLLSKCLPDHSGRGMEGESKASSLPGTCILLLDERTTRTFSQRVASIACDAGTDYGCPFRTSGKCWSKFLSFFLVGIQFSSSPFLFSDLATSFHAKKSATWSKSSMHVTRRPDFPRSHSNGGDTWFKKILPICI